MPLPHFKFFPFYFFRISFAFVFFFPHVFLRQGLTYPRLALTYNIVKDDLVFMTTLSSSQVLGLQGCSATPGSFGTGRTRGIRHARQASVSSATSLDS